MNSSPLPPTPHAERLAAMLFARNMINAKDLESKAWFARLARAFEPRFKNLCTTYVFAFASAQATARASRN